EHLREKEPVKERRVPPGRARGGLSQLSPESEGSLKRLSCLVRAALTLVRRPQVRISIHRRVEVPPLPRPPGRRLLEKASALLEVCQALAWSAVFEVVVAQARQHVGQQRAQFLILAALPEQPGAARFGPEQQFRQHGVGPRPLEARHDVEIEIIIYDLKI